jgi:hypothetical protein
MQKGFLEYLEFPPNDQGEHDNDSQELMQRSRSRLTAGKKLTEKFSQTLQFFFELLAAISF